MVELWNFWYWKTEEIKHLRRSENKYFQFYLNKVQIQHLNNPTEIVFLNDHLTKTVTKEESGSTVCINKKVLLITYWAHKLFL